MRPRFTIPTLLVLGALSAGCSGDDSPDPARPDVQLAAYSGQYLSLFDDGINAAAVGLSLDGGSPATDPLLPLRVRESEVVARMRVQTVTVDEFGSAVTYRLTLQVGHPPLAPATVPDPTFELAIKPTSNAFAIVRSFDQGMRGKTFIGFVRRFSGAEGPEIHWHLTADSAEVAEAIQQHAAFSGPPGQGLQEQP